jgi:prepilin-type N-terminal cleavage/methylation domain-containing protein|tara:strand:- start:90 stop:587 length:498 start_codon:yes stop_codon:yes gene_type:complete
MAVIKKYKKQIQIASKGFTLIELIVMIALLGILAAVASTRVSDISGNARVSSAMNQISSDIELIKEIALAKQTQMSITYDHHLNNCTIRKNGNIMVDYPGSENGVVSLSDGIFSGVNITQININGSNIINFDKWGNVLNNGTITLNNKHIITINKLTGYTEVTNL